MPNTYKPIFQKLTVNTTVTLLTCPSSTTINIARITICNISTSSDIFELCITRSGTDYFEAKGVSVPGSAMFKVEGPIILEAGDILKVKASNANRLDVVGSYLAIT